MSELLPCAHCGSTNIRGGFIRDGWKVQCYDCGAMVSAYQPDSGNKAIAAWNRRASPPAQTGEWVAAQYQKIQDFIIYRRLFKDQPNDKSHADIVLELAERALTHSPGTAEARWVPWKPGDALPPDGIYYVAWDSRMEQIHGDDHGECHSSNFHAVGVRAYHFVPEQRRPTPPRYVSAQSRQQGEG